MYSECSLVKTAPLSQSKNIILILINCLALIHQTQTLQTENFWTVNFNKCIFNILTFSAGHVVQSWSRGWYRNQGDPFYHTSRQYWHLSSKHLILRALYKSHCGLLGLSSLLKIEQTSPPSRLDSTSALLLFIKSDRFGTIYRNSSESPRSLNTNVRNARFLESSPLAPCPDSFTNDGQK